MLFCTAMGCSDEEAPQGHTGFIFCDSLHYLTRLYSSVEGGWVRVWLQLTIALLVEKEKEVSKLINGRHQVRPLLIDGHYSIGCSLVK